MLLQIVCVAVIDIHEQVRVGLSLTSSNHNMRFWFNIANQKRKKYQKNFLLFYFW